MSTRVLCVDDEQNVLDGLSRTLAEDVEVETAISGEAGLAKLAEGRFAVVVSDMRMPGMNGAAFLAAVRELSPETVRILLTGQSDLDAAIAAVNEGAIFRFLQKPCPPAVLLKTVLAAAEQHRLVCAERELLEGTVRGVVKLVADVLAVVSPVAFNRASRLQRIVAHVATALRVAEPWQYEVAALLSPLGCIALPEDLVVRTLTGQPVTPEEQRVFDTHPQTAFRLLSAIPRFDAIASIVRAQRDEAARSPDGAVELGRSMLRVAFALDDELAHGRSGEEAIAVVREQAARGDAPVAAALEGFRGAGGYWREHSLRVDQLGVGMVCEDDVLTSSGSVLVPKGSELTSITLERLRKFAAGAGVREPLRVRSRI